jgi:hypothetical protein
LVGLDLGAIAFPLGPGGEPGGSLLQGVQQEGGAAVLNAVFGDRVHHLLKTFLHSVKVIEDRNMKDAGIAVLSLAGVLHAAGASIEMEIAKTLVANSGRTAVNAICLEMVAGTEGHGCLQNTGYQPPAINSQPMVTVS